MKKINLLLPIITFVIVTITSCQKKAQEPVTTTPDPQLTIVPLSAHGGDIITARGKGLFTDISTVSITINSKAANIINSSPDSVQAVVPASAGSGKVVVTIGSRSYNGSEFTYEPKVIVTTIAGTGSVGSANGQSQNASFYCPWGISADTNGDLYIADVYNRLIRKISAADNTVSSFAIPSFPGSPGFASPYNLTIDPATHNMFVTDFNAHVMKMDPSGNMTIIYVDSMSLAGIALTPDGNNLLVGNNNMGTITKINKDGSNPTIYSSGIATPRNIIFDNKGKMYVAAYPASVYSVATDGSLSPIGTDAEFQGWEIATDTAGNFYLADHFKNRIRMIDKSGNVTTIAGNGVAADIDGIGLEASFDGPQGLTIDAAGNLYVTTFNYDTNTGNKVRKISFE